LFTGIAALIAVSKGLHEVVLGENGVMAINCPLTAGRVGGFSTHTAHPDLLSLMSRLFTSVFGSPITIANPLLYKTKTEAVADVANLGSRDLILETHSCWVARTAHHCGVCVPCIVRRFATEAANVADVTYQHDVFGNPPQAGDEKFANIGDYLLFATNFAATDDEDLLFNFDELNVEGGPDAQATILQLHRRWSEDVLRVATGYEKLAALM
jgi:hypothetical protein